MTPFKEQMIGLKAVDLFQDLLGFRCLEKMKVLEIETFNLLRQLYTSMALFFNHIEISI